MLMARFRRPGFQSASKLSKPCLQFCSSPLQPSVIRLTSTLGWVDADRGALQSNGHLLCLERAIGERQEIDSALWETGAFQAQVYPDLPIASSWIQLATKLFAGGSTTGSMTIRQRDGLIVRTVGAQCRSRVEIQKIMRDACIGDENTGPAGALLLVSGSHPARQLPLASCFLQSSFTMLLDAQKMRERGEIPSNLALWAVENPMISPPGRLQSKIDAGAEVILTQPPFTRTTAERWFQAISDSGAGSAVKIIAGVPMVSSLSNLEFWIRLCGFSHRPEAAEVRRSFPSPQQYSSKQELEAAIHQWNADFVQWTLGLPCVRGLHVMPLTKAGRNMTMQFLQDNTLTHRKQNV